MAQTPRTLIALPAAVIAFAALASCGSQGGNKAGSEGKAGTATPAAQASKLFPDDFKGVCSGASVSTAKAYDSKAAPHKALYFETYKDDLSDRSSSLPPDWTVQFSPDRDAMQAVDLVACARRTAAQEVKVCDGYKDNDKPLPNKVRWHTATYQLSVWEARTGKKLGETTAEATDADCPMFMSFDNDTPIVDDYASLSDRAVADFLRPYMTR